MDDRRDGLTRIQETAGKGFGRKGSHELTPGGYDMAPGVYEVAERWEAGERGILMATELNLGPGGQASTPGSFQRDQVLPVETAAESKKMK